jgi:hypothetical protein
MRGITKQQPTMPQLPTLSHITFGAERQIWYTLIRLISINVRSPGMPIAERSLFLGIARMLWAFDITPKTWDGKQVPIYLERLTQGFVYMPEDFECDIIASARRSEREKLIRDERSQCVYEYVH